MSILMNTLVAVGLLATKFLAIPALLLNFRSYVKLFPPLSARARNFGLLIKGHMMLYICFINFIY